MHKIIIVGDGRLGKTSLLRRLRGEEFDESQQSTRGAEMKMVRVTTPFSKLDEGKTVSITGDDVRVDGMCRQVNWRDAKHCDLTGTIKSVVEMYRGTVKLEDDREFENADGWPTTDHVDVVEIMANDRIEVQKKEEEMPLDSCRLCKKTFGLFRKRHHCYECEQFVCANADKCSKYSPAPNCRLLLGIL